MKLNALLPLVLVSCCRGPDASSLLSEATGQEAPAPALTAEQLDLVQAVRHHLEREIPAPRPTTFVLGPLRGPLLGETYQNGTRQDLVVAVDSEQGIQGVIDTLIHEWAHAVVWDVTLDNAHDELWGVAYSRCYRAARAACVEFLRDTVATERATGSLRCDEEAD